MNRATAWLAGLLMGVALVGGGASAEVTDNEIGDITDNLNDNQYTGPAGNIVEQGDTDASTDNSVDNSTDNSINPTVDATGCLGNDCFWGDDSASSTTGDDSSSSTSSGSATSTTGSDQATASADQGDDSAIATTGADTATATGGAATGGSATADNGGDASASATTGAATATAGDSDAASTSSVGSVTTGGSDATVGSVSSSSSGSGDASAATGAISVTNGGVAGDIAPNIVVTISVPVSSSPVSTGTGGSSVATGGASQAAGGSSTATAAQRQGQVQRSAAFSDLVNRNVTTSGAAARSVSLASNEVYDLVVVRDEEQLIIDQTVVPLATIVEALPEGETIIVRQPDGALRYMTGGEETTLHITRLDGTQDTIDVVGVCYYQEVER